MTGPQNIVIDARWITPTPSGIGVYTREIIRRLPALEPAWRWHLLFRDPVLRDDVIADCGFAGNPKVTTEILPYGLFSPVGQLKLPKLLRKLKCDIFHSTNFMVPYFAFGTFGTLLGADPPVNKGCGVSVVNIHDAIPLLLRQYAPRSKTSRMLWFYRDCLKAAIRCSAATITGSKTSKHDIAAALDLDRQLTDSISVVYDGVSGRFSPAPEGTVRKPGDAQIILYVGRLDPYKNVPMLVDAFAMLRHRTDSPLHLMVVGPYDARYPEARNHARDRGIAGDVTFLHDASDADLLEAYRNASVLVNPSRYEGFGLPMLEAMKCGIPVICADGGSQREVSGGAAEVVPPGDEPALIAALERVLFDDALRAAMTEKGLARAAEFTWETTARETLAVYHQALEQAGRFK